MEIAVIKNQRLLRKRVDKLALRKQVRVQNLPQKWPRTRLPLPFNTSKSQSALSVQFTVFSLVSVFFFSTWPVKHSLAKLTWREQQNNDHASFNPVSRVYSPSYLVPLLRSRRRRRHPPTWSTWSVWVKKPPTSRSPWGPTPSGSAWQSYSPAPSRVTRPQRSRGKRWPRSILLRSAGIEFKGLKGVHQNPSLGSHWEGLSF